MKAWLAVLRGWPDRTALIFITHLHIHINPAHAFWPDFFTHLPQVSNLKGVPRRAEICAAVGHRAAAAPILDDGPVRDPFLTGTACDCRYLMPCPLQAYRGVGGAVQPRAHDRLPSAAEYAPRAGPHGTPSPPRHCASPLYCLLPHSGVGSIGGLLRGCGGEFVSGEIRTRSFVGETMMGSRTCASSRCGTCGRSRGWTSTGRWIPTINQGDAED